MAAAAAGALLSRVQAHVANLAASTHNARYHVAVDDNAAAHAGTDGDHHHVLHALGRTEPGLAHGSGVGIVLVLNDRVGTVLLNGDPQLGQVNGNVGLDLGIARCRDGARNGQANTCHKGARNLRLGDHLVDSLGHRGKARGVNDGRRRHAGLGKQVAVLVEQALLNRSAADVNADVVLLRFHGSPPFSFKHCLYGTAPKAKTYQKGTGLFWQVISGETQSTRFGSLAAISVRSRPRTDHSSTRHYSDVYHLKRSDFTSGASFDFIFLELFNNSIEILRR